MSELTDKEKIIKDVYEDKNFIGRAQSKIRRKESKRAIDLMQKELEINRGYLVSKDNENLSDTFFERSILFENQSNVSYTQSNQKLRSLGSWELIWWEVGRCKLK